MRVNGYPHPRSGTPAWSHFLLLPSGSRNWTGVVWLRVQPLSNVGRGLPSLARPLPPGRFAGIAVGFPHLLLSSLSLPARKGPGLAAGGTTGRRARRANTTWARRSVVAAAAPPDPRPIAPRRARHLLNPLGLGLSRPLGPRGAGPIGQKLPRTREVETARPGVPAPGLGARRLPSPQTWASPSILVAPGKQPSGTKTRQRPGSVPRWRRNLFAPLTRVSFRRSRPRPAAAGRQREGAPALAGRAHGAAAFPFSSQRKCFGRQIIPGDMKLLRPPHVARKKNRNEHLWRDELVEDLTDVLSTSFLGRGPFPSLKAFHSELLTVTCSVAKREVTEPARVGALLRGR